MAVTWWWACGNPSSSSLMRIVAASVTQRCAQLRPTFLFAGSGHETLTLSARYWDNTVSSFDRCFPWQQFYMLHTLLTQASSSLDRQHEA